MYNPELASTVGISLIDMVIFILYLGLSPFYTKNEKFSDTFLIGILFLLIKASMNYYQAFYIASLIFIFVVFQSLFRPSEDLLSSKLMILSTLIIISNVIFYVFPIMIIAESHDPIKPNDLIYGSIGGLVLFIFLVDSLVRIIRKRKLEKDILYGLIFLFYFALTISIAVVTGLISHLIYGLALQLFPIIIGDRLDKKRSVRIYMFGFLLAIDNIIGFLVYPQYSPFPQPITSLLSGIATLIMLMVFIKRQDNSIWSKIKIIFRE